jgi:hypothetical protein
VGTECNGWSSPFDPIGQVIELHVCVCMYMCICVYVYMYVYVCICMYVCVCMYVCMCICMGTKCNGWSAPLDLIGQVIELLTCLYYINNIS